MSLITLKNEITVDVLVCIACLSKNRKLFSIQQTKICQAYKNLVGYEVTPYDGYPQYICSYCTNLLNKFNTFKEQCLQARLYLDEARMRNCVLPNFEQPKLNITQTNVISYIESETDLLETNNFEYDDTNFNLDLPSPTGNLKIFSERKLETKLRKTKDNSIEKGSKIKRLKGCFELKDNLNQKDNTLENSGNFELKDNLNQKDNKLRNSGSFETKDNLNKKDTKLRSKSFESKDNLKAFEVQFDVNITILSIEQQHKDVVDRKLSGNYLSSPYKCELCYKGFMGDDLLKKHVSMQHDPSRGTIVCEFCSFRYKDRRGLNQHLKSHRLKFACRQCSYVSRTTFNAKEHFKMHGGQLHECRHCGKAYEKLSSHLTHLRIQHPSQLLWCDVCGEAFIGDFGLNAHKKQAHTTLNLPSLCTSCDTRFVDTTALNRHLSSNCRGERSCVHCGENFKLALDLRDHLLSKHRSRKIYACEKCDKTFSRQSLYSAHYRRIHVTSQERVRRREKPWVCEVCGKTLPNKCMLLYHQRNHTGEKPYHCTQCGKSFTMKKLLQSHLRVHSSDRPYACRLCPKTFKGLSALRAHERIHTGDQEKRNITI